eukprot:CAMPEP_0185032252 /NCGR_PEP_ID=MMETSP1103-20130426/20202_1 /TAXON_ID=36769 /ORGANISM="Paraphysomonas bandaiensis, Strain Caron Lab Isolate" /LENGTH=564 /DNA_ID=CAMNT_0027568081 /DNA_START=34 /DNA_END=1728 /DNA_ORIENTATION=-
MRKRYTRHEASTTLAGRKYHIDDNPSHQSENEYQQNLPELHDIHLTETQSIGIIRRDKERSTPLRVSQVVSNNRRQLLKQSSRDDIDVHLGRNGSSDNRMNTLVLLEHVRNANIDEELKKQEEEDKLYMRRMISKGKTKLHPILMDQYIDVESSDCTPNSDSSLPSIKPSPASSGLKSPTSQQFRRSFARQGSKDDISLCRTLPPTNAISPTSVVSIHSGGVCKPGEEILSQPMVFWRCELGAVVTVFYHKEADCFEVSAVDTQANVELERVYVRASRIFEVSENGISAESNSSNRHPRFTFLKRLTRQRIDAAANYLVAVLDADYKFNSGLSEKVLTIGRSGDNCVVENLTLPRPHNIIPGKLSSNLLRSSSIKRTNTFPVEEDEDSAQSMHGTHSLVEAALSYSAEAGKHISVSSGSRVFACNETVNPRVYSQARWRWIWAIKKVISLNRISYSMQSIFGGVIKDVLVKARENITTDCNSSAESAHQSRASIGMTYVFGISPECKKSGDVPSDTASYRNIRRHQYAPSGELGGVITKFDSERLREYRDRSRARRARAKKIPS